MKDNEQPIEKKSHPKLMDLDVHSVWKTIQGEGPLAGNPAIFVRLAGCNLRCRLCDTDYTSNRRKMSPIDLRDKVNELCDGCNIRLVVLTGGEPFRQNITPLCKHLMAWGFRVQIETNGTIGPHPWFMTSEGSDDSVASIVCSPKTPTIHPKIMDRANAFKYILQDGFVDPLDGLPLNVLGMNVRVARPDNEYLHREIYVQPLDEQDEDKNRANVKAAVDSSFKFGYRLCLQQHKQIGLD